MSRRIGTKLILKKKKKKKKLIGIMQKNKIRSIEIILIQDVTKQ